MDIIRTMDDNYRKRRYQMCYVFFGLHYVVYITGFVRLRRFRGLKGFVYQNFRKEMAAKSKH